MSPDEIDAALRGMLRRASIRSVDDANSQQFADLSGLAGERPSRVHRLQQPGISHVPVAGAEGLMLSLGGRSDRALFFGGEHERHRPTGYTPGDTVIYDAHGNFASLVKASLRVVHAKEFTVEVGGFTMKLTPAGCEFTGGYVKSNGKSIDHTHVHSGIVRGGANTDPPAN